jgi:hypothetical protein
MTIPRAIGRNTVVAVDEFMSGESHQTDKLTISRKAEPDHVKLLSLQSQAGAIV